MHFSRSSALLLLLALLASTGCVVPVEQAPCQSSANCPVAQVCVGGLCRLQGPECLSDPACTAVNAAACDPTSDRRVGTCVDVDRGCLQVRALTDCGEGEVCSQGSCGCPAASAQPLPGAGCTDDGQAFCDGGTLVTCAAVGACHLWSLDPCAASGLTCATPDGHDAGCFCAPNPTRVFAADPEQGSPAGTGVLPTGAADPAQCRFSTLTEALDQANTDGGRVVAMGYRSRPWAPAIGVAQGEIVLPVVPSGTRFRATVAGVTGREEPAWPTSPGATVEDGTVTWRQIGLDRIEFSAERFPLEVGPATELFTSDCADRGVGCTPAHYAVFFGPDAGAQEAVRVDGGVVAGLSVLNAGAPDATALVRCAHGSATLRDLVLRGEAPDGARLATGLEVGGDCSISGGPLDIGGVSGAAIEVDTTGSVELERAMLGGTPFDPPLASLHGVHVQAGDLTLTGGLIRGTTGEALLLSGPPTQRTTLDGLQVTGNVLTAAAGAAPAAIRLEQGTLLASNLLVNGNGGAGLELTTGAATAVVGTISTLSDNGKSGAGGAIVVSAGTLTATSVDARGNAGPCLTISGGSATASGLDCTDNFSGVLESGSGTQLFLTAANLSGNAAEGLRITGGQCTLTGQTTIAANGLLTARPGVSLGAGGTLAINGGDGGTRQVVVETNGAAGLELAGSASLSGVEVRHNAQGIAIASAAPVRVVDSRVLENGTGVDSSGIEVSAADGGVTLIGNDLTSNPGVGLRLAPTQGPIAATLIANRISVNRGDGVVIDPGAWPLLLALTGNEVVANGSLVPGRGAGVRFLGAATVSFDGNRFLENSGSQLTFTPATAQTWTLGTGSGCGPSSNVIACLPAGAVGIFLDPGTVVTPNKVNANGVTLEHAPAIHTDWEDGTNNTLTPSVSFNNTCIDPAVVCP